VQQLRVHQTEPPRVMNERGREQLAEADAVAGMLGAEELRGANADGTCVAVNRITMPATDTELAAAVRRTLDWYSFVPTELIRATVTDGVVTLEGNVPYTSQRLDAARVIRGLAGVRGVVNNIVVNEPRVAPHAIRAAIVDALVRQAEREMRDVQIDIVDGRVTLTGNVHSAAERRAIIGAATGTDGVEEVISQLHVVP
jgi:osmotically-inducible protein OsmY